MNQNANHVMDSEWIFKESITRNWSKWSSVDFVIGPENDGFSNFVKSPNNEKWGDETNSLDRTRPGHFRKLKKICNDFMRTVVIWIECCKKSFSDSEWTRCCSLYCSIASHEAKTIRLTEFRQKDDKIESSKNWSEAEHKFSLNFFLTRNWRVITW